MKTDGGGTHGKYRYICLNHDTPITWNETAPHKRLRGPRDVTMPSDHKRKVYLCRKCGQPKKGHVCGLAQQQEQQEEQDAQQEQRGQEQQVDSTEFALPPLAVFATLAAL